MSAASSRSSMRGPSFLDVTPDGDVVASSRVRHQAEDAAAWFGLNSGNPREARQWADALRGPIEQTLEDLGQRPERAGRLLAPVIDAAIVEAKRNRFDNIEQRAWQWLSILVSPTLWKPALGALWEGEPVWQYLERTCGWYEVVECMLFDANSRTVLGRVESKFHKEVPGEQPLERLIDVPMQPSESDDLPWTRHEAADPSEVIVLVGAQCRLAVRVYGMIPDTLRPALKIVCDEADVLLDRPAFDEKERAVRIERLLKRALLKNSPSASPWTWPTALSVGGLAVTLIVGVLAYYAAQEYRWQKALAALQMEPGLQITQEHTTWGRREVMGFHDPFARDPVEVLSAAGIDTSSISFNFKTYLSGDPAFASAHNVMNAKQVMSLSLDALQEKQKQSTKVPEQKAPVAAPKPSPEPKPQPLPEVKASAPVVAPPAAPKPSVSETLTARKALIEAMSFSFEPGQEALMATSVNSFTDSANKLLQFQIIADGAGVGFKAGIEILKSAGPPEGGIWQLRHSAVRDALVSSGIRSTAIDTKIYSSPSIESSDDGSPDAMKLHITIDPAKP